MGKITVRGEAEKEFDCDIMDITIIVRAHDDTFKKAVESGQEEVENVLEALAKISIDSKQVELKKEQITKGYRNEKDYFMFDKQMEFHLSLDMKVWNAITNMLASVCQDAEYNVDFCLSDEHEKEEQLLQEAVKNARKSAENIARSMHHELAELEMLEIENETMQPRMLFCKDVPRMKTSRRADDLSVSKIKLSKSVKAIWNIKYQL